MNLKIITLKIDNSNWYRSLESAWLSIKSPKGGTIYIKKIRLEFDNEIDKNRFYNLVGDCDIRAYNRECKATIEDMEFLLKLSKLK